MGCFNEDIFCLISIHDPTNNFQGMWESIIAVCIVSTYLSINAFDWYYKYILAQISRRVFQKLAEIYFGTEILQGGGVIISWEEPLTSECF